VSLVVCFCCFSIATFGIASLYDCARRTYILASRASFASRISYLVCFILANCYSGQPLRHSSGAPTKQGMPVMFLDKPFPGYLMHAFPGFMSRKTKRTVFLTTQSRVGANRHTLLQCRVIITPLAIMMTYRRKQYRLRGPHSLTSRPADIVADGAAVSHREEMMAAEAMQVKGRRH
jgi:hypothetical protein